MGTGFNPNSNNGHYTPAAWRLVCYWAPFLLILIALAAGCAQLHGYEPWQPPATDQELTEIIEDVNQPLAVRQQAWQQRRKSRPTPIAP